MTYSTLKTCRDCGSEFKRSPADSTVRCPACRRGKPKVEKVRKYDPIPCCKCGHVHTTLRCDRCGF